VGVTPASRRIRAQAELAAAGKASVLLVGPAGSGRQHLATTIHYGRDSASAGVLVPVECAILGPELIQSAIQALAVGGSQGNRAARSTLVLNQADQLAPEVQAELVTAFSSRTFAARLVATAEEPLVELVRRGRYREDLAVLLSTITIELPPLAQRRDDLPMLAQAFLEEINARGGKQIAGFTPEALDRIHAYPWPGNLNELVQVVAESHAKAGGTEITARELPERFRLTAEAAARPRRREETIVLDEFIERIERELIRRAMARAKGNKARAARLLGMTRPRLYRRMVQLGLETEGEE
jgi:DNA-binding NtrC family response regulator